MKAPQHSCEVAKFLALKSCVHSVANYISLQLAVFQMHVMVEENGASKKESVQFVHVRLYDHFACTLIGTSLIHCKHTLPLEPGTSRAELLCEGRRASVLARIHIPALLLIQNRIVGCSSTRRGSSAGVDTPVIR